MPPPPIISPSSIDFSRVLFDHAYVQRHNPQRHEFSLLDAVVHLDPPTGTFAGYHEVRENQWWGRAHIPGRPIFPGVLMIECAAQLASFAWHEFLRIDNAFLGFAAVDEVKYRGIVEPPCRLLLVGRSDKLTPRRTVASIQGFVGDSIVFECKITGMPV